MANYRDIALELVENGMVSAEELLTMALKYMRMDDVEDMLDTNELSERFFEDDDDGSTTIRLIRRVSVDFLLFLSLDDDDDSIINFLLVLDILKMYYIISLYN